MKELTTPVARPSTLPVSTSEVSHVKSVRVLSPIGETSPEAIPLALRRGSISQGSIVLLSNGKPNASALLNAFGRLLQQRYPSVRVTLVDKTIMGKGSGHATPLEVIEGLSAEAIAVLSASGD